MANLDIEVSRIFKSARIFKINIKITLLEISSFDARQIDQCPSR